MSTATATKTVYTPEDLLAMPDGKSYELVNGELVEHEMGTEPNWVGDSSCVSRLGRVCERSNRGRLDVDIRGRLPVFPP